MRALKFVGAVPSRSTLPVLNHVLISARAGKLTIAATDIEQWAEIEIDAEVLEEGVISLPKGKLAGLIGAVEDKELTFAVAKKKTVAVISGEGMSAKLYGLEEGEFPAKPKVHGEVMKVADFPGMLARVVPAVSTDESRYVLNGVCLQSRDGSLRLVATDGRRLHMLQTDIPFGSAGVSVIVPPGALNLLLALGGEVTEIILTADRILARSGEELVMAKLVDGVFPNVDEVVPEVSTSVVTVCRASLRHALVVAGKLTSGKGGTVRIEVGKRGIQLRGEVVEVGSVEMFVPSPQMIEVQIAFSSQYFSEALAACRLSEVAMEITDSMAPMAIRENGFTAVVMPMRVEGVVK